MLASEICVITRDRNWSQRLRRVFAQRHGTSRFATVEAALKSWESSFRCVIANPSDPGELQQQSGLPQILWRSDRITPVVLVLHEHLAAARTISWENGAAGVFTMTQPLNVIAGCVVQILKRWQSIDQMATATWSFQRRIERLTPRELFIMQRLMDGWWLKRIANALGTSVYTVRHQRASLLQKLEVTTEREMLRLALSTRWLHALASVQGIVAPAEETAGTF